MEDCDPVANKTLTEKHLRRYGSFLEQHHLRLMRLLNSEAKRSHGDSEGFPYSAVQAYPVSLHIWDCGTSPVALSWTPVSESCGFEEVISIPLPPDGNPDVQKVLLVLTSLITQLKSLRNQAQTKFIFPIALYGEGFEVDLDNQSASATEGDGHVAISKFLPTLFQLQQFLKVVTELCVHWMSQIGALYKDSKPHVVSISNLHLPIVFREFGNFLATLVILDEVLRNQSILHEHWSKYREMISFVQADCASFGTDSENLFAMDKELFLLEKEVISGQIFRNCLNELNSVGARCFGKGVVVSEKFQNYLSSHCGTLEKDFQEGNDELKPIAVVSLFLFASTLFPGTCDWRKFFQKTLLEILKKVPAVPIGGAVLWTPDTFFNSFPLVGNIKLLDSRAVQACSANRQTYLQQKVSNLQKEVLGHSLNVGKWAIKLQEVFYSKSLNQLKLDDLSKRCNLLLQGVKYAQNLSQCLQMVMNLHASLRKPISKQVVGLLCQLQELLKEIQSTFFRFSVQISNSALYIVQHVMHTALLNVKNVQKHLSSPEFKKMDEIRADSLSVLKILENSIRGPPSEKRLLVAKLTLDWALASSRLWKGDDAIEILPAAIERIFNLVEMEQRISELCDGSNLFWHRVVLSTYLASVFTNEIDSCKLPLFFMVLQDCYRFLDYSPHREQAKKSFIAEMGGYIKSNLQDKLCQEIETDLRLLAHSHLQVEPQESNSPFRAGVKEYNFLLQCPTLYFESERAINFRLWTEYYLSKTFYNLASVALHDWQSYVTMRVLAAEKYHLDVVDDHLPGHRLEQGRDILEIVRNLPKFVQEFTYNLNNQVFVQVASQNKHLDTVNIRHLANSMRTHGPGMANTTVNATYQYLRPKLHTFSQFLYEEQIRSRLAKDIRLFKQTRQDSSATTTLPNSSQTSNFPYKFAEKFKKGIKKLGVQDELTWLDHFRILITQIGNALGFVRLVRSGGLHYLAGGCRFVPDLEDIQEFLPLSNGALVNKDKNNSQAHLLEEELEISARGVDSSLRTLTSSFSGGVDYFKLLVVAFSSACRDEKNSHLKNFYVIIPALTLSYVDHMRLCKEMLAKKSKSATIFTDDGFPMGLAYLMQVLGQDEDFDSLGWFMSVKQHYDDEKQRELHIINESRNDQKLEQASKLTAKRFQDQLYEFELLRYNLSSARIFFQHIEHSKK